MYLAHERRAYILRQLEEHGSLRSAALAHELQVTDETIRTDLVHLQAQGLLRRVHGGAVYLPPAGHLTPQSNVRLDIQLAQHLADNIPGGTRILITDSALAPALATCLRATPCTFITPSPELILKLAPATLPHTIECTGGQLDKTSGLLRPADPETELRRLKPDIALLSPLAVTPRSIGYTQRVSNDWARAAVRLGLPCLIAVPSSALSGTTPPPQARHTTELTPTLLVTEDNLPPAFRNTLPATRIRTVPYISRATLTAERDWEI